MNQIKVDNYTKGILTLIAFCLLILTCNQLGLFPKTYATDANNTLDLLKKNYGLVPINADGTINVNIVDSKTLDFNMVGSSKTLDVKISDISNYFWNPIAVKVVQ